MHYSESESASHGLIALNDNVIVRKGILQLITISGTNCRHIGWIFQNVRRNIVDRKTFYLLQGVPKSHQQSRSVAQDWRWSGMTLWQGLSRTFVSDCKNACSRLADTGQSLWLTLC